MAKEQLSPVGHTGGKMSTAALLTKVFFFFFARLHGHFGRVVKASAC